MKTQCNLFIKKKRYLFLVVAFSFAFSYSQEAEKIFHEDFSKISIVLQPAYQTGDVSYNNDRSSYPSLDFKEPFSFQFGFYYNFAQSGAFNFKTGLIAKPFKSYFDINIKNEDLGLSDNIDYSQVLKGVDPLNTFMFSIPFKPEYIFRINEKLNAVVGLGVNLNLTLGEDDIYASFYLPDEEGNAEKRVFYSVIETTSITVSGEFSIGLNYDFNFALLQVDLFYNDNLFRTAEGHYIIENVENVSDKRGLFDIQGDYYGVSFLLTPKKSWLRRKK